MGFCLSFVNPTSVYKVTLITMQLSYIAPRLSARSGFGDRPAMCDGRRKHCNSHAERTKRETRGNPRAVDFLRTRAESSPRTCCCPHLRRLCRFATAPSLASVRTSTTSTPKACALLAIEAPGHCRRRRRGRGPARGRRAAGFARAARAGASSRSRAPLESARGRDTATFAR